MLAISAARDSGLEDLPLRQRPCKPPWGLAMFSRGPRPAGSLRGVRQAAAEASAVLLPQPVSLSPRADALAMRPSRGHAQRLLDNQEAAAAENQRLSDPDLLPRERTARPIQRELQDRANRTSVRITEKVATQRGAKGRGCTGTSREQAWGDAECQPRTLSVRPHRRFKVTWGVCVCPICTRRGRTGRNHVKRSQSLAEPVYQRETFQRLQGKVTEAHG